VKFRFDEPRTQEYYRIGRLSEMYETTINSTPKNEIDNATIRVEESQCPIMIISGGDDAYGPQTVYREVIIDRLRTNQFPYQLESLYYPQAGHRSIFPYVPTTELYFVGGDPKHNAEAIEDAWNKVLMFVNKYLV